MPQRDITAPFIRWAARCVEGNLDEFSCHTMLARVRYPRGLRCPCSPEVLVRRVSVRVWRCGRCRRRLSVTAGTILEGTRLPLRLWVGALWHLSRSPNGISALRFHQKQHLLGCAHVAYSSIWRMFHVIRALLPRTTRSALECEKSAASALVCGRRLQRNRAAVTLVVRPGRMRFEVRALPRCIRGPRTRSARVLLEQLRTWIAGTFHGVSKRYLALYAREFFARHAMVNPLGPLALELVAPRD